MRMRLAPAMQCEAEEGDHAEQAEKHHPLYEWQHPEAGPVIECLKDSAARAIEKGLGVLRDLGDEYE